MYKKIGVLCFVIAFSLFLVGNSKALDLNISGNGAGSNNTLNIQGNQSTKVTQKNSGSIDNNVNAGANTGGNEVSGGNGGTVKTGDASTNVNINNNFNNNTATVPCCPSKTPTPTRLPGQPTPTPTSTGSQPTSTPTPAQTPPVGVGGPPDGGGDGDGGNGGGGNGGGQVMGLSQTAGDGREALLFYLAGALCLSIGGTLLKGTHALA